MITTNALFAALGLSFLIFSLLGITNRFHGSVIIPDIIYKMIIVLSIIILVTSILGWISAYSPRRCVIYIYMVIVAAALILQVVVGVLVYQKGANYASFVSTMWSDSSNADRLAIQNEFTCCGLTTSADKPALSNTCSPNGNSYPPCAPILNSFVHDSFSKLYLIVFAALVFEVLALTNAVTLLCAPNMSEEESERRRRRKSGIKLEDMSTNSTSMAGSNIGGDAYSPYSYKDETASVRSGNRYNNGGYNSYNRQENDRYY
ncbi:hypothetical protein INT43_008519 [Umbelopsis isabellina]|uniref:Tetraspanin n=1 Tax=Mortierella isabellina TaxID=91625 RepID=A0A8H7UJ60_MORIS|nr:hypothetical protein INT43_008519 [Umbelopsis isabellina]